MMMKMGGDARHIIIDSRERDYSKPRATVLQTFADTDITLQVQSQPSHYNTQITTKYEIFIIINKLQSFPNSRRATREVTVCASRLL